MAVRTKTLPPDRGLTARMMLTVVLLGALYLFFTWILLQANAGIQTMVLVLGLMLAAQYFLSDRLALLSMGAREVTPQQAPELHDMVARLAALADLPKPKVAISPARIPNAFAVGRNQRTATVAVTQGLLDQLEPHELEAVVAHEITHIKNRDVAIITFASFFATLAGYLTQHLFYWGLWGGFGGRDDRNGANWGVIVYLVSILVYTLSFFLIRALSRYREFAADRGAAILTGAPSHLASALIKISGRMKVVPQRDLREAEAMNAFFIAPALSGDGFAELFSTHPSLERRLAHLRRLEEEMRR
ncbi:MULTISPECIES: zinc metalloprotease HtpX [Limnochorda]|uniref:zinc metalloprotease HtpX n=1 Tax=Limnochorda TaxID=1676651 RepID=UPI001DDA6045|nr:zinc metalloprotease HtpX [Limnochorda pilosa]MBO2486461.1 zinc metalloprotease HtpX [Bacillota bacterium]MBO2519519.1 zinc metalloprotease HtpX [Bacillota bacterium]